MIKKIMYQMFAKKNIELDLMRICKLLRINNIKGPYYEFGVYKGKSMLNAYNMAKESNYSFVWYYGFDTFTEMPKPQDIDKNFKLKGGEFKTNYGEVLSNLKQINNLTLIAGNFEKTLTSNVTTYDKASLIYIDCDYYESTKAVLKFIKPLLQQNTIIVFADWFIYQNDDNKGQRLAFKEFSKNNQHIKFEEYPNNDTIKIFIVKKINEK